MWAFPISLTSAMRRELVPFRFEADPAVQPQASKFYVLLESDIDDDDFITQPAQVREIDQEVYKYVGSRRRRSGADRADRQCTRLW